MAYKARHLRLIVPKDQRAYIHLNESGALWAGPGAFIVRLEADELPPAYRWLTPNEPGRFSTSNQGPLELVDKTDTLKELRDSAAAAKGGPITITDEMHFPWGARNVSACVRILTDARGGRYHFSNQLLSAIYALVDDGGRAQIARIEASIVLGKEIPAAVFYDAEDEIVAVLCGNRCDRHSFLATLKQKGSR